MGSGYAVHTRQRPCAVDATDRDGQGGAAYVPTIGAMLPLPPATPTHGTQAPSVFVRALEAVIAFPAIAALIVGLLYATGVTIRAAQLRAAGLRVGDVLPQLPIEQHLAQG